MKKNTVLVALAAVSLVSLGLGTALGVVWQRSRSRAGAPGTAPILTNAVCKAKGTAAPWAAARVGRPKPASPARVLDIQFDGEDENPSIRIDFSKPVDPAQLNFQQNINLMTATANAEKVEGVTCYARGDEVHLRSPNFKRRASYTVDVTDRLRFRNGPGLESSVRRTIKCPALPPSLRFADSGRYLPPVGDRAVVLACRNVTNLACSVRRILPQNIVQLLAREENHYRESLSWLSPVSGDSASTCEIAALPHRWQEKVAAVPDKTIRHALSVRQEGHVASNGVYLLSVAAEGRDDPRYRVICLTDLGLSIRRESGTVRVWVTSLTHGRSVNAAEVSVYAANGQWLATATTDRSGACLLSGWDSRYEPFAVVATAADGTDSSFLALGNAARIEESAEAQDREAYLAKDACEAFVWSERGIFRHDEKIMLHALLRTGAGVAPKPFPLKLSLVSPAGRTIAACTRMPDERGAVAWDGFSVPADRPSGQWQLRVSMPGKDGWTLGSSTVKIEDFVPAQVRVSFASLPEMTANMTNLHFRLHAEHLFGGAARDLLAEGLVVFSDVDFSPKEWKNFRFGNPSRGLSPNFTRLGTKMLDENGEADFVAALDPAWNPPRAAVRMTVQGSVLEQGGRPSVARESCILHAYPYYLGTDIPTSFARSGFEKTFSVVQVRPDGSLRPGPRMLTATLQRVESVYNLVKRRNGTFHWDCTRVRSPIAMSGTVRVGEGGRGTVTVPSLDGGEYELCLEDGDSGVSHFASFWVSTGGDDEIRASLKNPTSVTITPDKALYREGDCPRLTVKAPFRGEAWLAILREKVLSTRTLTLTNLTSVVELGPLEAAWAPNVEVAISVVQSVEAGKNHLAARAHGLVPLAIRPRDREMSVKIEAAPRCRTQGGSDLAVRVTARAATGNADRAVITVVDEGINLLTQEKTPDPVGYFARLRTGSHPLYDLYSRLLPICDSRLNAAGAKTGGDGDEGLLNRISPVPSRRFRSLSQWQLDVPLTNGVGFATFRLPEFVGEVRVTALAYGARATGCASVQQKICPKLVMQPDAPRFVAPGDRFGVTLSLANRAEEPFEADYEIQAGGGVSIAAGAAGKVRLEKGASTLVTVRAEAGKGVGSAWITCRSAGAGEEHVVRMELPVRPAVPWEESVEVVALAPGKSVAFPNRGESGALPEATLRTLTVSSDALGELVSALDYLAEYPYGCLEQTVSRMFPLLYGGGLLQRLPRERTSKAEDVRLMIQAGVDRVVSLFRGRDFTMWPDADCPPWDREVSQYAAHFLIESSTAGYRVPTDVLLALKDRLRLWAQRESVDNGAYACLTLALAGAPVKDRMLDLYDRRKGLSLAGRARLARALLRVGEPERARTLLAETPLAPQSVKEASLLLLALQEREANDARLPALVTYLQSRRDRARFHWGTTGENAHALMALAAYFGSRTKANGVPRVVVQTASGIAADLRTNDVRRLMGGGTLTVRNEGTGSAFVTMKSLVLPAVNAVTNAHHLIRIARRHLTLDGAEADLANVKRGDLLIVELTLSADSDCRLTDLIVQDLLPAGFEPADRAIAAAFTARQKLKNTDWVLRTETRDDRVLVFSRPVEFRAARDAGRPHTCHYAVRLVTDGDFALPGARVEAMYEPEVRAWTAPARVRIAR